MPPSISSRVGPSPGCGSFLQEVQNSSSQHNDKQWEQHCIHKCVFYTALPGCGSFLKKQMGTEKQQSSSS
jgi:uncharacterized protein YceK